jgi:phenylalanyl-tRNA synthetase beta chain
MQRRLRLAGQRPINVVVDISNYVMLEMGQPNHTFDYDFLSRRAAGYSSDGVVHINTRLPQDGESITTLDGVTRELPDDTILVTDPAGALSIGGIMGGIESEISDQTTNVLLEAAAWNFMNIRRSSTTLRITSEAGFRFSRGVHPSQALIGARRAAELLRKYAGGTVANGIIDYYPNPFESRSISLRASEVKRIGGIDPSQDEIADYLRALEFQVEDAGDHLQVKTPDHRMDIEGSHDLIEEVCRMYGYDRIPTTEMSDTLPPQRSNTNLANEERIKDILVGLGLQEIITYRLTTAEKEARLLPPGTSGPDDRPYVKITNPITVERVAMRHSALASALEIVAANSRFRDRIAVFEVGRIYLAGEDGVFPDELRRLTITMTGPRNQSNWNDNDVASIDFHDLKGVLENLFEALHINGFLVEPGKHPTFRPGRTARLLVNEDQIGWMGELHPQVVDSFDIRSESPVLATDLDLEVMLKLIPGRFNTNSISPFPAILEDIAIILDASIPAGEVSQAIMSIGGPLLKSVELFDVYGGQPIPEGKKSLAYHLIFQSPGKTLTDKAVRKNRERIVRNLERQFGAALRDA